MVEFVQFVLQGVDEPTHRQQPDDEYGKNEEHTYRPFLYVTFFKRYIVSKFVSIAESKEQK